MVPALPGQTFTFRSLTWTIGADGNAEIVEAVQGPSAPIEPTSPPVDPVLEPPLGSTPSAPCRSLPRYPRRQIDNKDLIASINWVTEGLAQSLFLAESVLDRFTAEKCFSPTHDRRTEWPARTSRLRPLDSNLVIQVTPEGRTVQRRPLPATSLRLADYEALTEELSSPYPFGLMNAMSTYQDRIPHLFMDHVERDHVSDLYLIDLPEADRPVPVVNMV